MEEGRCLACLPAIGRCHVMPYHTAASLTKVECYVVPVSKQSSRLSSILMSFSSRVSPRVTLYHLMLLCYVMVCSLWPLTASDCLAAVTDVSSADSPSPRAAVCTKNLSLTLPRDEGVWMPS